MSHEIQQPDPDADMIETDIQPIGTMFFGHGIDDVDANLLTNCAITPFQDPEIVRDLASEPKVFGSVDGYVRDRKIWLAASYYPTTGRDAKMTSKDGHQPRIPMSESMRNCVLVMPVGGQYGEPLNDKHNIVCEKYFKTNHGAGNFEYDWEAKLKRQTWNRALQLKFHSNSPEAKRARDVLLNTENMNLLHVSRGDDATRYWHEQLGGVEYWLGRLLMEMRAKLRSENVQVGGDAAEWDGESSLDVSFI